MEIAPAPFSSRPAVTRRGHEDYSNNCTAAAKGLNRRRPRRYPDGTLGCAPLGLSRGHHSPGSFANTFIYIIILYCTYARRTSYGYHMIGVTYLSRWIVYNIPPCEPFNARHAQLKFLKTFFFFAPF